MSCIVVDDLEPDGFRYTVERTATKLIVTVVAPDGRILKEKITSTSGTVQLNGVEVKLTEEIAGRLARKLGWMPK